MLVKYNNNSNDGIINRLEDCKIGIVYKVVAQLREHYCFPLEHQTRTFERLSDIQYIYTNKYGRRYIYLTPGGLISDTNLFVLVPAMKVINRNSKGE